MKASSAQDAIRALPEMLSGPQAATILNNYADQLRTAANNAPSGIVQKTYGIDGALKAADDIDSAATQLFLYAVVKRPSNQYSTLQLMVGKAVQEMYGIQGQLEVFRAADAGLIQDLKDNAKIAGAGLGIAAIVALAVFALVYLRPMNA